MKFWLKATLFLALAAPMVLPLRGASAAPEESCSTQSGLCWPVLKLGASGEKVVTLQTLLNGRGLGVKADGKFGSSTQNAVRALQKQKNFSVDGIVGAQTWAALVPALERGAHGESVRRLQVLLNRQSKSKSALKTDGFYGAQTATAVRKINDAMSFDTPAPGENRAETTEVTWCALLGGHFDGE